MPLGTVLADFQAKATQCNNLIANAHKTDVHGASVLPPVDQQQITVAAFLNLFIAWETFLEEAVAEFMTGSSTISGTAPVKYVAPVTLDDARKMVIGSQRFFDYANVDNVRKVVGLYFKNGYPFEPHLGAVYADIKDMRTMRNASAHLSSSTQTALESLALRIFGSPRIGISLYHLLTAAHPGGSTGQTVFSLYRDVLLAGANQIATG